MRHRRLRRKLGVKTPHRKALLRNLVRQLVIRKRIRTTLARAKEASSFADRMVTIAKRGDLQARRLLISKLGCNDTARSLVRDIAPQFKDRAGGYTRVLRLDPRPGDGSSMALLEFTTLFELPEKKKKSKKTKKEKPPKLEEISEEKPKKEKEKNKEPELPPKKGEEPKEETEKKGGFLATLRRFLKGSD